MRRNIIYIINPISGVQTKSGLQQLIEKKSNQCNISFQVVHSVANGDYSFLIPTIREQQITDVVIAGGDGTVNQVVGSLLNQPVDFGILPFGSGNGLAYSAKIPKDTSKALDIIFNGKASAIDGFFVNGKFACMLCGLGFDAKVAHEFAKQPKRGLKTYATLVSRNFFSATPYPFLVEANGLSFSTEAFFISIANSNQFGNQFTIAPKASLADGLLDIVIAKKTAKPLLLFNLIKQVVAGKLKKIETSLDQPINYFQTGKLFIQNSKKAPMHIDGDPVPTFEKIEIEIAKESFRLIQPV